MDWEKGIIQVDESLISKLMGHACRCSMKTTAMRHMYKQDTKDSPVNVGTEEVQVKESPELVTYLKGEPVIGIFGQETKEFDCPMFNFDNQTKHVGHIIKDTESPLYCHSRDLWVRAKTSISRNLEHQGTTETKKSLEELIPVQYQKFQKVLKKATSERLMNGPGTMQLI